MGFNASRAGGPARRGRSAVVCAFLIAALAAAPLASARWLQALTREAPGPELHNWNHDHTTTPAVLATAENVQDVMDAVADTAKYPSPLLPVASMHSVTRCNTNDGGTILSVAKMNKILGLDTATGLVTLQTGTKLADLHDWLGERGWEISFSPEIGDASAGSLVVTTSKDSSLDGPGYLTALVRQVKYVNASAQVVTLKAGADDAVLKELFSSYGTKGVVVELILQARPQKVVRTFPSFISIPGDAREDYESFAQSLLALKDAADNLFTITSPGMGLAYAEQRFKVADQDYGQRMAAGVRSFVGLSVTRYLKYQSFLNGALPAFPISKLLQFASGPLNWLFPCYSYRRRLVNRYPAVTKDQDRLDFTYYEHPDLSKFVDVVASALEFVRDYKAANGYQPPGLATYFVDRPGGIPSGSNYFSPAGTSFMLDPISGDPSSPDWSAFLVAFNKLMVSKGAVTSLSQTKFLDPSQTMAIPAATAQPRFTTKFYSQYVAA